MLGPPEPQFVEKNNLRVPVYRYSAQKHEEVRFHYHTNPAIGNGWKREGIAFYGAYDLNPNSIPLYDFYYDYKNTGRGGWKFLLGTDLGPVNGGWTFNGTLCKVFQSQETGKGAVPIYKYNKDEGDGVEVFYSTKRYTDDEMCSLTSSPKNSWKQSNRPAFYAYRGQIQ